MEASDGMDAEAAVGRTGMAAADGQERWHRLVEWARSNNR